ncbi:MAG: HAD family phosphatase [Clostridiales bacterium]|nr:HAD family phosphatase [Clostridiales bacterium]
MIKNVIFDMGNVILAYDPIQACYRHGQSRENAEKLCSAIFRSPQWGICVDGGLMTDREYIPDAQSRLDTWELKGMAAKVLRDWWHDGLYPITGMDRLIEELLKKGVGLYILSNVGYSFPDFAYKIPHFDRFSGVVLSCEEKLRKPDPALFLRLCDRYGLKPAECLFVDDLASNVAGAESVGMLGHVFSDGDVNQLRARIRELTQE